MSEYQFQPENRDVYHQLSQLDREQRKDLIAKHSDILTPEQVEWMSGHQQQKLFGRVSHLIDEFRQDPKTLDEMLGQPWEKLRDAFLRGQSMVYCVYLDNDIVPVAHSAMWELGHIPATDDMPECRVDEFGSWIVARPFRGIRNEEGKTLGEHVAQLNLENVYARDDANGVVSCSIATVKRANSMHGLEKVDFEPVSFHDNPELAAMTCSCPSTSELFHDQSCPHRRGRGFGEDIILADDIQVRQVNRGFEIGNGNEPHKIPCTLMLNRPEQRDIIREVIAAHLYGGYGYDSSYNGELTVEGMRELAMMFDQLQFNA